MKEDGRKYKDNLISIIVPAFNAEKTLETAIRSLQDQDYTDWEAFVVDDASTDGTKELMQNLAEMDHRIRPIYLERNQGAAVARNEGLKQSVGRYVAFLDADDYWATRKLAKQLDFMRHNDYGFTYTGYTNVYEKEERQDKVVRVPESLDLDASLKNTVIGCLTVMIDREQIGEFYMPEIRSGQDHVTWWRILEQGHRAYGLQENLAYYRIGRHTLSSNKLRTVWKRWYNYRQVMGFSRIKAFYYFSFHIYHGLRKHYF
jgi:teichuronic acid biosynthesis glycosyltransferase TuaG